MDRDTIRELNRQFRQREKDLPSGLVLLMRRWSEAAGYYAHGSYDHAAQLPGSLNAVEAAEGFGHAYALHSVRPGASVPMHEAFNRWQRGETEW